MSGALRDDGPDWFQSFRQDFVHNRPRHIREADEQRREEQQQEEEEEEGPPSSPRSDSPLFSDGELEEPQPEEPQPREPQPGVRRGSGVGRSLVDAMRRNDLIRMESMAREAVEDRGGAPAAPARPPTLAQVAAEEARQRFGYLPSTIRAGWKNASLFQSDEPEDVPIVSAPAQQQQQQQRWWDREKTQKQQWHESQDESTSAVTMLGKRSREKMKAVYETGDYCFLCWWGDNGEDAVRTDVWNRMVSIWMENVHWMGEEEAACAVSDYQYEHIVMPMRADGKNVGEFPPADVMEHFTMHVLDPRLEAASTLRDLKLLRREILKCARKNNSVTGDSSIDKDQVINLKNTLQMMRDVYSWPVKKMQFYVPQWKVDTKHTKSLFSLHRNFEFVQEDENAKRHKRRARPPR